MGFASSILFGAENKFCILGIDVEFKKQPKMAYSLSEGSWNPILHLADFCLQSRAFGLTTLGCAHVFVHEMGHAIAHRCLTGTTPKVTVITNTLSGYTICPQIVEKYSLWYLPFIKFSRPVPRLLNHMSIMSAMGPLTNTAFANCQLITAVALRTYISWPVSVALATGAVIWMFGELLYAITAVCGQGGGDFGCIHNNGKFHLALAVTALVAENVLATLCVLALRPF